jgi:hypothetical protein
MPIISIRQLISGMVLAAPVMNFLGNTLLKSDTTISEKHIITLKSWGVKSVTIIGESREDSSDHLPVENSQQSQAYGLERMFSTVKDQPIMQLIYEIVKKQALKSRSSP